MAEKLADKTIFSLLEVTRSIQKTLADRYQSVYWIKAEMNKLNHYTHSGHAYPELVEKKDGKIVAEIRSVLWKTDYERINKQFLEILQEPLRDGITILFQAGISYDPLYGLSLKILDIDSTFVLGELEKEKKESINRLRQEGLFDQNKSLSFPLVPKRLAIISVETSKGLSDFLKIIDHNPWNYRFESTLYPALLQGDKSVPSILKQMAVIVERAEAYDALLIVRGGGGEVGLSSYNNYLLAKAISMFPIPVLTGIGHSTNETVSEMVAYKNAITPSELADFLIQRYHQFALPVMQGEEKIVQYAKEKFLREHLAIQQLTQALSWKSKTIFNKKRNLMSHSQQRMELFSRQYLKDRFADLAQHSRLIQLANPLQLLKRGFSITRVNGKAIIDLSDVSIGDEVETTLAAGQIKSTVTQKT